MQANLNLKTIFGIKLKRTREALHLTLAQLSERAHVSTSYLAEIEAGKKYPKAEKILLLSQALGCSYDELISSKLDSEFDGLQELLDSPGLRDFPFAMFGVPADELVKLLTRAPTEVAALLRTLNDVAQQYNIGADHFLHAALRSYQELTGNYYEDLETAAEEFGAALGELRGGEAATRLAAWVTDHCGAEIDGQGLAAHPALLEFRSVLCLKPRRRLMLHPRLSESQKAFVLAREAGYKVLGLRARSLTTPPDRDDSFEQVLSDFKASYFAGALLLPRASLAADVQALFQLPVWRPEALLQLLHRYDITPETLMYRLSQVLPGHLGLRPHFLRVDDEGGRLRQVKQLNLSDLPVPSGIGDSEHHCRRWLSVRLLAELAERRRRTRRPGAAIAGVQHARFVGKEDDYFCFGMAVPVPLRPEVNSSLTLGFRADDQLRALIRFSADPALPQRVIGSTCEQCPLTPAECADRAAPPGRYLLRLARADRQRELKLLTGAG